MPPEGKDAPQQSQDKRTGFFSKWRDRIRKSPTAISEPQPAALTEENRPLGADKPAISQPKWKPEVSAPAQPKIDRFGRPKVRFTGETEKLGPVFTQQEAAVFSYVLSGAIQELYGPQDQIGEGTSAQEVQDILDHQQGKLDKNFRKVASNGPEYFLRIRIQAVDKIKKAQEEGGKLEDVTGQDFDDLALALSSFNPQEFKAIASLIAEKNPEEVISGEFPRGVLEDKPKDEQEETGFKPERTMKDEIGDIVALFDSRQLYDVPNGVSMVNAWRVSKAKFDALKITKATELGVLTKIGETTGHKMAKFSREDLLALFWIGEHYDFIRTKLTPSQEAELGEVRNAYREIMASRAKPASTSAK